MFKVRQSILAAMVLGVVAISPTTHAGGSANAGFVSDYYFRGANLGDGGLYAGFDYESNGFFVGTWGIDDGTGGNDGLETDVYFGYGMEIDSFSWGIGYNRYEYTYTSDFEDEIELSLGYGAFSLKYADGTDSDESLTPTVETDYSHYVLGVSGEVFAAAYGSTEYDNDPNGSYDYIEFSATGTIGEFDVAVTAGDASFDVGDPGAYMFLDISKSFDLF